MLIIGVFLGGGLLLFLLVRSSPNKVPETNSTASQKASFPIKNPNPQNINSIKEGWQIYDDQDFKFWYPQDWKVELAGIKNGGEAVSVKPVYLADGNYYPRVIVEKIPITNISLNTRNEGFIKLGFNKTQATLGKISVSKYTMSTILNIANDSKMNIPIYSQLNVFEFKGNIYTVGYEIDNNERRQNEEKVAEKIVSSFILSALATD